MPTSYHSVTVHHPVARLRRIHMVACGLLAVATAYAAEAAPRATHDQTIQASGKWQNVAIVTDAGVAAQLKRRPLVRVDLTVPPEQDATWFQARLAIQADGLDRTESPTWIIDRAPGATGIHETMAWDLSGVVAKLSDDPPA